MKSLLYKFRRYRAASLLNLLGLGIAAATFYIFMTQVVYNYTYNHNIKDHERIYRLEIKSRQSGEHWISEICRPFVTFLKNLPHVEDATYICPFIMNTDVNIGDRTIAIPIINMGKSGIEFFTGSLVFGSSKTWDNGSAAIISQSIAKKLFGTENAVGKTLLLNSNNNQNPITVVGVSEDMPDNCTLPNGAYICDNERGLTDWGGGGNGATISMHVSTIQPTLPK